MHKHFLLSKPNFDLSTNTTIFFFETNKILLGQKKILLTEEEPNVPTKHFIYFNNIFLKSIKS